MKRISKIMTVVSLLSFIILTCSSTAFAITEAEVQSQVTAIGKEAVTGNVLIWFLCAIAFLKISQKIDSFMSSLGINVGHTGGSILSEALVATRGISEGKRFMGGGFSFGGSKGSFGSGGSGGSSGSGGFLSGGLAGVVNRNVNKGAVKSATGQNGGGVGGKMFSSSLEKGGSFANNIIGNIAKGDISSTGTMTGETAAQALTSYLGYNNPSDSSDINELYGTGAPMGFEDVTNIPTSPGETGQQGIGHVGELGQSGVSGSGGLNGSSGIDAVGMTGQQGIGHLGESGQSGQSGNGNVGKSGQLGNTGESGQSGIGHIGSAGQSGVGHVGESGQIGHLGESGQGGSRGTTGVGLTGATGQIGRSGEFGSTGSSGQDGTDAEIVYTDQSDSIGVGTSEVLIQQQPIPSFSNVEIGGGHITGTETSADHPKGIEFGMYNTDKYMAPEGKFTTVEAVDGSKWYKQYAADKVEKTPYKASDGSIAYKEEIVQKLPRMPQRKDKV